MKFFKHFKTITKHRHIVIRHCKKAGIFWQGLRHDLSKYSPSEFIIGAKYYQGDKSPNEIERKKIGYSTAWMHHKGRNKHHYEYWNDYIIAEGRVLPVKMPIKYLKEMFCDRVAASKIYQGDNYTDLHPYEYFKNGHDKPYMHPETAKTLSLLLEMLAEKGEDATFEYIRNLNDY